MNAAVVHLKTYTRYAIIVGIQGHHVCCTLGRGFGSGGYVEVG